MVPCPSCGTHLRARDRACFSCGATTAPSFPRASAAALLLGLSVACTGTTATKPTDATDDTGTPTAQPLYGVTPTDGITTDTGEMSHTATYTGGVDYGVHTALELEHSADPHSGGHSGR